MSTIGTLQIWKDTGYTEGCLDMPSETSSLPSASFTYSNLNVARDRLFSEVQVKGAYEDMYDCSYLKAVYDMNNGSDVTVYGWIDSVECSSDTTGSPMTRIYWHVDHWRTYLSQAVFKSGMVKRRPLIKDADGNENDSYPPQGYPYRFMKKGSGDRIELITGTISSSTWWVIFTCSATSTSGSDTNVEILTCAFPVSKTGGTFKLGDKYAPSLNDIVSGKWDEKLGLDPNNVFSVFLSPFAPNDSTGSTMTGWSIRNMGDSAVFTGTYSSIKEYSKSLSAPLKSDDVTTYCIRDFDGNVVGTLPWGVAVQNYTYRLIIDSQSAYVQIRFAGIDSHMQGICFTIPLIPVALSANGWSSYTYSGARQADIDQARTEVEKSTEQGALGTLSSGIQGAASGAMMGSLAGPLGVLGGALLGGVTSAVSQGANTAIENYIGNKYNAKFQSITDYRAAHQSNGLLMSGTGFDAMRSGQGVIDMVPMAKDDYAVLQRKNDISLYGLHVSEPRESCQALIDAGGPLQIENLTVTGPIPVSAKDYFKTVFARGVRIV